MDQKDKITNKLRDMQHQIRQNAMDTQSYLADLQEWEKDIRKKDAALLDKSSPDSDVVKFLVRNAPSLTLSASIAAKLPSKKCAKKNGRPASIKSSDYRAWDHFDADKACDDVDYVTQSKDDQRCGSECECDQLAKSDEEIEGEARHKRAEFDKSKGNEYFEKGKYQEAVECYSTALSFDQANAVYYANRAMAFLKLKRFSAAEEDCSKAVQLNPIYVKAYHRRATARLSLKNLSGAKEDFAKVSSLEPNNKDAKEKLGIIKEWEQKYLTTSKVKEEKRKIPEKDNGGSTVLKGSVPLSPSTDSAEKDSDGRIRVYPLLTPSIPVPSKPLRKLEIRDSRVQVDQAEFPITDTNVSSACVTVSPSGVSGAEKSKSDLEVTSPKKLTPSRFLTPNSALEFAEACACLFRERNNAACADYIEQIAPTVYGKFIGHNLSSQIFFCITTGAVELSKRGCEKAGLEHLAALSRVPRFSFFVHSLTAEQRSDLHICLEKFLVDPGSSSASAEVARATAAHFLIKL